MLLSLARVRDSLPGFGMRPLTKTDFGRATRTLGITVDYQVFPTSRFRGMYIEDNNEKIIFIDSRLTGDEELFVSFHELGHALLHSPGLACCSRSKQDFEADAVALIALFPVDTLPTLYLRPKDGLVRKRFDLFNTFHL